MFANRGREPRQIGLGVCVATLVVAWCCSTTYGQQLELAPQVSVLVHSPNLVAGHTLGYWPVVCVIENGSKRRYEIEVRCPEATFSHQVSWRAVRKVNVEPQSTARITLWLPSPAFADHALEFFVNGRQVQNTLRFIGLSHTRYMVARTPRVLVSSDAAWFARGMVFGGNFIRFELTEDPQQVHSAHSSGLRPPLGSALPLTSPFTGTGFSLHGRGNEWYRRQELTLCVWDTPIRDWDAHWISFSPFQGMVLTAKDWWDAPAEVQEAIIRWVTLGGVLLFLDVQSASPPRKLAPSDTTSIPEQATLLLDDFAPDEEPLRKAALARRQEILSSFPATDAIAALHAVEKPRRLNSDGNKSPKPGKPTELAQLELRSSASCSILPCGFGQVHYVLGQTAQPTKVTPGSTQQVFVYGSMANLGLTSWGQRVEQGYRAGIQLLNSESEYAWEELLQEAFQGVRGVGVPVLGFFLLLLLFSALIGPVTLGVLGRLKRRIWLVWVVPVIALTASLVVFLYGFLAEGVSARIAVRALTVLDERHHRATTLGVLAVYSPITPPGGMQFDYDTEPTFLRVGGGYDPYGRYGPYNPYPPGYRRRRGMEERQTVVDWSEKQHLVSGYVLPRVTEYAAVRRSEVRRERLEFRRDGQRLFAANGLGCGVRKLLVCDHDGKWWRADSLPAGQEIQLQPCDPPAEYHTAVSRLLNPQLWLQELSLEELHIYRSDFAPGEGFGASDQTSWTRPGRRVTFYPGMLNDWLILGGEVSGFRHWLAMLLSEDGLKPHHLLCPGRYLVELEESRFLSSGLRWVKSRDERCWVVGIFNPVR